MVELQRARLGLPPTTTTSPAPAARSSAATPLARQSSAQLAAATMYSEEVQLKKFLQRLSKQRDDSHASSAPGGPTVPTALARRMLQQQGVGYLDDTVAALASAAADRFLATVLQQAVACRDRRCKGTELAKEEAAVRKKHVSLYQQDAEDRKRRKHTRDRLVLERSKAAVAAAKELSNGKGPPKKKTKKAGPDEPETVEPKEVKIDMDEPLDDDSLDEEERYYQEYYQDDDVESEEDEEDDTKFMLLLRDLERPLAAWQFKLTGKVGLGAIPMEAVDPDEEDADAEDVDEAPSAPESNNGEANGDESRSKSPKPPTPSKTDESESVSRATTPMVAPSPVPPK